jgi:hypothetical protein
VQFHIEVVVSTSSRLPARIIMKSSCGGCSHALWKLVGQEPEQTPHCMHIFTQSPISTCSSISFRKLLRYFSATAVFALMSCPCLPDDASSKMADA